MRADHEAGLRYRIETVLRRTYPSWLSTRVISVRCHCSLNGAWQLLCAMHRQGAVERRGDRLREQEWRREKGLDTA